MAEIPTKCPHCNAQLKKWRVPPGATWDDEYFLACFDNDCSYYKRGWDWMMEQYSQKASYRYAVNPTTGASLPLPVWSDTATSEMLFDDDEGEEA